jgi:hypothetical protein
MTKPDDAKPAAALATIVPAAAAAATVDATAAAAAAEANRPQGAVQLVMVWGLPQQLFTTLLLCVKIRPIDDSRCGVPTIRLTNLTPGQ